MIAYLKKATSRAGFAASLIAMIAATRAEPATLDTPTGTIAGTLILPKATGSVPVVLIIAGSGPTDRDGNVPSAGSNNLKMLADALATQGIASLRYDKRGIGGSAKAAANEAELRFENYADDAGAWADQLAADRRFNAVIILGHSEGALIGSIAAQKRKVAGFISVEGAGRPAADVLRDQLKVNLPPALLKRSGEILASLEAGKTTHDVPAELASLFRPSVQPYLISWFKYDPAKELAKVPVPVLIVQGSTDLQVPAEDSRKLAAANSTAQMLLIQGMNHVLKTAKGPLSEQWASYTDPKMPLADGLAPGIMAFIRASATKPNPPAPATP